MSPSCPPGGSRARRHSVQTEVSVPSAWKRHHEVPGTLPNQLINHDEVQCRRHNREHVEQLVVSENSWL